MEKNTLAAVLVVHQNSAAGREEDYNDWYSNIHIRDVMRLRGAISAQRLQRHPLQVTCNHTPQPPRHEYFTLYELSDLAKIIDGHKQHARTERMLISNSGDFSDFYAYYFVPLPVPAQAAMPVASDTAVKFTARFAIEPGRIEEFEHWFYNNHAAAFNANAPGFTGARLFRIAADQLVQTLCPDSHFAIYSVAGPAAALSTWSAIITGSDGSLSQRGDPLFRIAQFGIATAGAYQPVTPRLTAESVRLASSREIEVERHARERLGNKVMPRAAAVLQTT